jgi:hypothetical protein
MDEFRRLDAANVVFGVLGIVFFIVLYLVG